MNVTINVRPAMRVISTPEHLDVLAAGNLLSEMVSKAIRSGVPMIVSKTYPSNLGIRLAKKAYLTLTTVRQIGDLYIWNGGNR